MSTEDVKKSNATTTPPPPSSSSSSSSSSSGGGLGPTLLTLARPCLSVISFVLPFLIINTARVYRLLSRLPQNLLNFLYGFVFCFFGGSFPTLFAAIQAAKHSGRQTALTAISDLSDEVLAIIEESKKDDKADDNSNGIYDVNEISGQELVMRKTKLVLRKMNPSKVNTALGALNKVWLSVAAVLKIEFARTIALSMSISDFLDAPAHHIVEPIVKMIIPNGFKRWVPVIVSWIVKSIAMSLAWRIQTVISAFASALVGGLMMARSLYALFVTHRIRLGGIIPEDHTQTNIDEALQYIFAAMGLYIQFMNHFDPPFPLNIVLLPFEAAEYYIRWAITERLE